MNRFVLFAIALSVAVNAIAAQSETDVQTDVDVENAEESSGAFGLGSQIAADVQSGAESMTYSAIGAGQALYEAGEQMTAEQQAALAEAMDEMTKYFEKSMEDMSNIMENTRTVIESNGEGTVSTTDLVDNLMSYVQDTNMMREQMGLVMGMRAQFQDSVLKQLSSMPISVEDAEKLEKDLRERMRCEAGKMSGSVQNLMSPPGVPQMSQIPQQITSMGSNYMPKFN